MPWMVQCVFEYELNSIARTAITVWVEWRPKIGQMVRFKDDSREWKVIKVGESMIEFRQIETCWEQQGL